jgi:hypothetical protein
MNRSGEDEPMSAPTDPMLSKVRKLLAKAEDPATTPEEAETYTEKAAALIAAYGIDQALLAGDSADAAVVGDLVVVLDAPYALDKAALLATVAGQLRCRAVQRVRYVDGEKQISLHLFGHHADLQRAELLYTSLLLQATSALMRTRLPRGENLAAYRRSWLAGFAQAVGRRLADAEQRAAREAEADRGSTVALVLADRDARVEARLQEEYPSLGQARRRTLSGRGAAAGWATGQRADLGGTRVPGRGRDALTG